MSWLFPDGGGLVRAAVEPIEGAEKIARYLLGLYQRKPDLTFQLTTVNGQAGLVGRDDGRTHARRGLGRDRPRSRSNASG